MFWCVCVYTRRRTTRFYRYKIHISAFASISLHECESLSKWPICTEVVEQHLKAGDNRVSVRKSYQNTKNQQIFKNRQQILSFISTNVWTLEWIVHLLGTVFSGGLIHIWCSSECVCGDYSDVFMNTQCNRLSTHTVFVNLINRIVGLVFLWDLLTRNKKNFKYYKMCPLKLRSL